MPIYEYECDECGHKLEALQRMSDDPLKECPKCKAPALRKLISAVAFKLKGQGWYESDFKKPAQPKGGDSGQSSDSKSQNSEKADQSKKTTDASAASPAPSASKGDS